MFLPVHLLYVSSASVTAAGPDTHRSTSGLALTAIAVHAVCREQQSAAAVELLSLSIHHRHPSHSGLYTAQLTFIVLAPIAGVMPNMSHCQITRSMRFTRHVGIIKPNLTLQLTLTLSINLTLIVTEEINIK